MRLSLRKRALVALGLALTFVAGAAAPAQAVTYTNTGVSTGQYWAGSQSGSAGLWRDDTTPYNKAFLSATVDATFSGVQADENKCVELWIDQTGLDGVHRAPDVLVTCRGGNDVVVAPNAPSGPLNITLPYGGGVYYPGTSWDVVYGTGTGQVDVNTAAELIICTVQIDGTDRSLGGARFKRVLNDNCFRQSGNIAVTPFDGRNGYIGELSYGNTIQYMNDVNEPQHIRADGIASLASGQTMYKGDKLVSIDGKYSARMQADGNFVVVNNASNTALWAASGCGLTPVAGSYITAQSDGNLVIYGPAGNPGAKWASYNINTCTHGYLGTGGSLEMGLNGNLVYYGGGPGGVLWAWTF